MLTLHTRTHTHSQTFPSHGATEYFLFTNCPYKIIVTDAEIIRKVTENKGEIEENSSEEESECPTQNAPSLAAALAAISVLRDYCTAHNVEDLEITKIEDAIFASRMKTTKQSKLTDYFSKL
jgi:hypothetical protein